MTRGDAGVREGEAAPVGVLAGGRAGSGSRRHAGGRVFRLPAMVALALAIGYGFAVSLPHYPHVGDLGSFVASGRAAAEGSNPYVGELAALQRLLGDGYSHTGTPNLNPPVSLFAFVPLARLDPWTAFRGWYVMSLGLYLGVVLLLARESPAGLRVRGAWAGALAGLWSTLALGQVYVPLLLAAALGWSLLRRGRHLPAGALVGLVVAVKPNLVVWPVLLLLGGYWLAAVSALASAALLSGAALVAYGPGSYAGWLAALATYGSSGVATDASLLGFATRLGLPLAGLAVSALLLLVTAAAVWRWRPPILLTSALGIVTALLASPLTWTGYTVLLLPIFFERRWTPALCLAATLLVFPANLAWEWSQLTRLHLVLLGSIYSGALLLVLTDLANDLAKYRTTDTTRVVQGNQAEVAQR